MPVTGIVGPKPARLIPKRGVRRLGHHLSIALMALRQKPVAKVRFQLARQTQNERELPVKKRAHAVLPAGRRAVAPQLAAVGVGTSAARPVGEIPARRRFNQTLRVAKPRKASKTARTPGNSLRIKSGSSRHIAWS